MPFKYGQGIGLAHVIKNDIHHEGREEVTALLIAQLFQLGIERTAALEHLHKCMAGIVDADSLIGKIHANQLLLGVHATGDKMLLFHSLMIVLHCLFIVLYRLIVD